MDAAPDSTDLDWVRVQIVELDDAKRALPPGDFAARDRINRLSDDLRTMLRAGYADAIHAVRDGWADRAGRKGGHEIDYKALEGFVRSMMRGDGGSM